MFNEILVGEQLTNADGVVVKARGGKTGEQIVGEIHGKYYEAALRGRVFMAYTVIAGVALPVAAQQQLNVYPGNIITTTTTSKTAATNSTATRSATTARIDFDGRTAFSSVCVSPTRPVTCPELVTTSS